MRKIAVTAFVMAFASATAFGGTVTFTPDKATVEAGEIVKFDLALGSLSELPEFDAIDAVVGSDDGLQILDFVLDPQVVTDCFGTFCAVTVPGPGVYASDLKFGFFAPLGNLSIPYTLGSLTVDTAGLEIGEYQVVINGENDQQSFAAFGVPNEALFGVGTINIVPEPATMSLLGLASLALIRRRKKA